MINQVILWAMGTFTKDEINTPVLLQGDVTAAVSISDRKIDNMLARLREIVPNIGARPGKGDRRRFSLADVRFLTVIDTVSKFLGEQEAAKVAMALSSQIHGIQEFGEDECLLVEEHSGLPLPPPLVLNAWESTKYQYVKYKKNPQRLLLTGLIVPFGQMLKRTDEQCRSILTTRLVRPQLLPQAENLSE